MRTLIIMLVSLMIWPAQSVFAADDKTIQVNAMPVAAQQFIKDNFAQTPVIRATVDKGFFNDEYKAYLKGGGEIEFDNQGQWTEIKTTQKGGVPASVIPQPIKTFVENNNASSTIIEIDRDKIGYDVKLAGGVELKFDTAGNFVRYDD